MNRLSPILALAALAPISNGAILFDSLFSDASQTSLAGPTDINTTPRIRKADNFILADRQSSPAYQLTSIQFGVATLETLEIPHQIQVELTLYDSALVLQSGQNSIFPQPPIFQTTVNLGVITFNQFGISVQEISLPNILWTNPDGAFGGLSLKVRRDTEGNGIFIEDNDLSPSLSSSGLGGFPWNGPYVGDSTYGYWQDKNLDNVFVGAEYVTSGNSELDLAFAINGEAVPEPASLLALGLGASVAFLRRKSRHAR